MKSGPHVFVMLGLYAGLRREEILGLKWAILFIFVCSPPNESNSKWN